MHYKLILVVDVESEDRANDLLDLAKDRIKDNLDLDEEDFVAGAVESETSF